LHSRLHSAVEILKSDPSLLALVEAWRAAKQKDRGIALAALDVGPGVREAM
jgi:hypothetical protein